jgi:hypothetical protein
MAAAAFAVDSRNGDIAGLRPAGDAKTLSASRWQFPRSFMTRFFRAVTVLSGILVRAAVANVAAQAPAESAASSKSSNWSFNGAAAAAFRIERRRLSFLRQTLQGPMVTLGIPS